MVHGVSIMSKRIMDAELTCALILDELMVYLPSAPGFGL